MDNNKNYFDFNNIEIIDVSDECKAEKNTLSNIKNNIKRKHNYNTLIFTILLLVSNFLIIFNIIFIFNVKKNNSILLEKNIYNDAAKYCSKLYHNNMINESTTTTQIDKCLFKIELVKDKDKLKELKNDTIKARKYINFIENINSYYTNDILNLNVSDETLNTLENELNNLNKNYLNYGIEKYNSLKQDYNQIQQIKSKVENLFQANDFKTVKTNITRNDYNNVFKLVEQIKQEELKQDLILKLNKVDAYIKEEEKKEYERIQNAWVKLNVPYISQNKFQVYNGCEAATLLMALKYKGYLKDMDLVTFAANMPKSDNPNTGFFQDIFLMEPKNIAHWIAPAPLVQYGINSSGNQNIINSTGTNLNQLTEEILNKNPVILYLTNNFSNPYNWFNGAPKNLHVLLLTGYNPISNEILITDPWMYNNNKFQHTFNLEDIEEIYNQVGKKSIIIR